MNQHLPFSASEGCFWPLTDFMRIVVKKIMPIWKLNQLTKFQFQNGNDIRPTFFFLNKYVCFFKLKPTKILILGKVG